MEHFDDQNVQLSSCLLYEQYSRWKAKSKSKANLWSSTRDRHVWELVLIKDNTISQSMGMKMQNPTKSSCTGSKTKSGKGTFWCMKKSPYIGYCPEIHMKSICIAQNFMCSFIHDEPRWRTWWTQMKIIMNTTAFWCSSEIRMFAQNFKLKLVGPRTHDITPWDILQRLYEPKDSINRDQGISKTCTIAKHTRKQLWFCLKLLQTEIDQSLSLSST